MKDILRRALVENAALKAVAMVLAITLFVLVRGDRETERSVRVDVAYVPAKDRELVSEVPKSVDVWVRGPWTRIKRLDPAAVDAIVVDLSKLEEGEYTFSESMIRLPAGLQVASIRPPKFAVQFEQQKRVPVVPETTGAPAEGFSVAAIQAQPPAVIVRGSRRAVDQITDARTLPIALAGKRASFRRSVALAPLPLGIAVLEDAIIDVDVDIAEEPESRALGSFPVLLRPPPEHPSVTGIELVPAKVAISLRGGHSAIARVEPAHVYVYVTLRIEDFVPGQSRQAVVLIEGLPAGVASEVNPREITVIMKPSAGKSQQ